LELSSTKANHATGQGLTNGRTGWKIYLVLYASTLSTQQDQV
jgi:hypothetical protein